ncbi:MAG TPA: alpha/beta hydrolase [Phototrophicaceae bacterium]|nr:alpha/beta hydrolase [Phototrophicaceae bacterium]
MLAHWTQNDLSVNGVRLHYYSTGNTDKRPLVLVHGFSDNGLCWTPIARELEAEYDVIMPDMRGHGLSERVQAGQKIDMAADLAGLIRTLELNCPIICGHSMGAMITYQIGVRFPELTRALILEDPPWWFAQPVQTPPPDEPAEPPIAKWARSLANQTLEELLVQYRKDHPDWPEELLYPMCESKKQLDPAIVDTMTARMHAQEVNWLTSIQNVTQPLLLFAANPELGGIVTPEVVAEVRKLNPKVTIINMPDVGHLIRFDKYAAFMDALWAFLKQLA